MLCSLQDSISLILANDPVDTKSEAIARIARKRGVSQANARQQFDALEAALNDPARIQAAQNHIRGGNRL